MYFLEPLLCTFYLTNTVQCKYERISDHEIALAENFASRRVLIFDLKWKAFTARYASLNYKLIEAVRERFIELGWDEM